MDRTICGGAVTARGVEPGVAGGGVVRGGVVRGDLVIGGLVSGTPG
ncbi:hypothetical protein ACFZCY_00865 [Streptomyces sp. NPDC007983]